MSHQCATVCALLLGATVAHAQPSPTTSADVAAAARPGRESGRVDPPDPGDSPARVAGRVLLWLPRVALELVVQPVRGVLYLHAEREAGGVAHGDLDPVRAVTIAPRVLWRTGFAPHVGVRVALSNLAGHDEVTGLQVGFGGHLGGVIGGDASTGTRFGPLVLGVAARYDRRNDERFFGFGNAVGTASRYHLRGERLVAAARVAISHHLALTGRGGVIRKTYGPDPSPHGEVSIETAYDVGAVAAFVDGATFGRAELEAAYDSRHVALPLDPPGIRDTGALILGYASRDFDLDGDKDTWRYGFELQRNLRLAAGPRELELRLVGEAIASDLAHVAFTEVPTIGGDLLHASDTGAYRDRIASVARATYLFAIGYQVAGLVFAEAGRVFHAADELTLADLHYGGGIAVEGYTHERLFARAELAVSASGGVYFCVALAPPTDGRSRVRD